MRATAGLLLRGRHLPALAGQESPSPNRGRDRLRSEQRSRTQNSPRSSLIVKGTFEVRLAGLVAVRIVWITAIVVCALAILIGLLSSSDGGHSSQQLPGFASTEGGDPSQPLPEFASFDPAAGILGPAPQQDRSGRAKEDRPGRSHSGAGIPPRSGSQLEDTGGKGPAATPRPKAPQAPQGDPAEAPQAPSVTSPEPTKAPSVSPPKPPEPPKPVKPPEEPSVSPPKPVKPPKEPSVPPPKPPKPLKPPAPPSVTQPKPVKPPKPLKD